ncbi:hypothetical protein pb186bvf_001951 [Paramecium bursaria]
MLIILKQLCQFNFKYASIFNSLLKGFEINAKILKNCSSSSKLTRTQNEFGDEQLEADVLCEKIVVDELTKIKHVSHVASEETPEMVKISDKGDYIVTFDPLDGSSIISTNFTVGTIVGIWKSDETLLIGQKGKDQISALQLQLWPTTLNLDKVQEYTLFDTFNSDWEVSEENIRIKKQGKIFAPGNTRCLKDFVAYKELVDYWLLNGYTLRYSGGMAPDVCQIFIKEEGVFTAFGTDKYPAKLRYLYECAPLAFLVEKAGGKSTNENGICSGL